MDFELSLRKNIFDRICQKKEGVATSPSKDHFFLRLGAEAAGTLAAALGKQRTARLRLSVGA